MKTEKQDKHLINWPHTVANVRKDLSSTKQRMGTETQQARAVTLHVSVTSTGFWYHRSWKKLLAQTHHDWQDFTTNITTFICFHMDVFLLEVILFHIFVVQLVNYTYKFRYWDYLTTDCMIQYFFFYLKTTYLSLHYMLLVNVWYDCIVFYIYLWQLHEEEAVNYVFIPSGYQM